MPAIWKHIRASPTRSAWPALLVILGVVLVPSVCVLWFMTEAMHNERMAVRQKLMEVYRQDLDRRQKQVDEYWQSVKGAMALSPHRPAADAFRQLVESGMVGSALVYRDNHLAYPLIAAPQAADAEPSTNQALALQAEARISAGDGQKERAITILASTLQTNAYQGARDAMGRLIAPDAALFAIDLMERNDARRTAMVRILAGRLRDDGGPAMPSAQRLFLMKELSTRTGERFPTMAAEETAVELHERTGEMPAPSVSHDTLARVPGAGDIWIFCDQANQIAGLWDRRQIEEMLSRITQQQPAGARVDFHEDGAAWDAKQDFLVVPLSTYMPRWFMTLRLTGTDPFVAAASRQEAVYLWTGGVGVAAIVILGMAMAMYLRRQMQLTRLKNDLTATVSHELKTPLSTMRVLVDTLVEGRCRTREQEKEYLGLIARENMRLSRLIDNFLAFSRMERNRRAFEFRPVELADVVRCAMEAIGERGKCVRLEIAEDLPPIRADHDALATVVVNLLDNAWKYSGDNKQIDLAASADGNEICLAVKDRGIGIARRHQRKIFQRFYQVDQTLARQAGGCGLGLSIVRFIVEAHGGRIMVDSQLSQGSTFTVRLPAMADVRMGVGDGR